MFTYRLGFLALVAAIAATVSSASAATFQYGFGSNNATANSAPAGATAQADFVLSGSDLIVTLTNTTKAEVGNGSELTAVYWNGDRNAGVFSNVALGATSSVLYGGDSFVSGSHLSGNANGGGAGWYGYGVNVNLDSGQQFALSSAGLNLTYLKPYLSLNNEVFPVAGYTPTDPDGPNGGLVGTGGVSGNLAGRAVVSNALVFTITGVGANFNLESIRDVQFQYNTSRVESNAVPLPAAAWMGLSTLVGGGLLRLRKKAHKA